MDAVAQAMYEQSGAGRVWRRSPRADVCARRITGGRKKKNRLGANTAARFVEQVGASGGVAQVGGLADEVRRQNDGADGRARIDPDMGGDGWR